MSTSAAIKKPANSKYAKWHWLKRTLEDLFQESIYIESLTLDAEGDVSAYTFTFDGGTNGDPTNFYSDEALSTPIVYGQTVTESTEIFILNPMDDDGNPMEMSIEPDTLSGSTVSPSSGNAKAIVAAIVMAILKGLANEKALAAAQTHTVNEGVVTTFKGMRHRPLFFSITAASITRHLSSTSVSEFVYTLVPLKSVDGCLAFYTVDGSSIVVRKLSFDGTVSVSSPHTLVSGILPSAIDAIAVEYIGGEVGLSLAFDDYNNTGYIYVNSYIFVEENDISTITLNDSVSHDTEMSSSLLPKFASPDVLTLFEYGTAGRALAYKVTYDWTGSTVTIGHGGLISDVSVVYQYATSCRIATDKSVIFYSDSNEDSVKMFFLTYTGTGFTKSQTSYLTSVHTNCLLYASAIAEGVAACSYLDYYANEGVIKAVHIDNGTGTFLEVLSTLRSTDEGGSQFFNDYIPICGTKSPRSGFNLFSYYRRLSQGFVGVAKYSSVTGSFNSSSFGNPSKEADMSMAVETVQGLVYGEYNTVSIADADIIWASSWGMSGTTFYRFTLE